MRRGIGRAIRYARQHMPAGDITLETTLPGATRRRVWAHPDVTSHGLVVLTAVRLYLAPRTERPAPALAAAVEAGGDLDQLLGPLATVVELIAVDRVRLDLHADALVVEYMRGGLGTARLTVQFAAAEAADVCFTKLWRRLGDGYRLRPPRRDAWALARPPLLLLVATLLVTGLLALGLSVREDLAARPGGARPAGPDWRAVCAAGGLVAGLSQVWLYRRFTQPPRALEVERA